MFEKIPAINADGSVNAVIEVPNGSSVKYELDKKSGALFVDRVLFGANFYPANYGFVPNTLGSDGDPLDILVISPHAFVPASVVKCALVGVLLMEDESGVDEKLLALPLPKIDAFYKNVKTFSDLPEILLSKIKDFFETYKNLEPGKWVKVKDFACEKTAAQILETALVKA